MGKSRVTGSSARISLFDLSGKEIFIGEVDKFSAKVADELKKSQPLGEAEITSDVKFGGYDLEFEGGKVDWNLAELQHAQERQTAHGGRAPLYKVYETIIHLDGTQEEYIYPECSLHGFHRDTPKEDISEKFSGFCGKLRTHVAKDATATNAVAGILAAMSEAANKNRNNPGYTTGSATKPQNRMDS